MIDQEEIHNQCLSEDPKERIKGLNQLKSNFSLLPDKGQAWNDLHRLANDKDSYVRSRAISVYGSVFSYVPYKEQAWNDLHILANDRDIYVRSEVASSIGYAFSLIPDKEMAWRDLHRLTDDEDSYVRSGATCALEPVFTYVPYKEQAWDDLHILTNDEDNSVKFWAGYILGCVFSHIPNKELGWRDLHRLINDEDAFVSSRACWVLGSVYSDLPDQEQAYNALHKLTNDPYANVRAYANNSLGKISIFKASQAKKEEDYKKELEKAITFFEKAAQESPNWERNPSRFCLPFYRSFRAIIFKRPDAREEVDKYLEEAKSAIEGSKSKELLFEAVNNLANALKEVQNLENMDLEEKKGELDFYRQYCNRAAELMRETEETAPFATIAMQKGLPILNRNLKGILEEIQKKTELISEQTKGTRLEELGNELNQNSRFLLQVRDPVGFKKRVDCIQNTISIICSKFPEGQKSEACELLKTLYEEPSIEDKIPLIDNILSKLSYQLDMTAHLNRIEAKLDLIQKELDRGIEKLDILSMEIGGTEGELIKTFSKKILELTEKGDKEALKNFLEEMLKNEDSLIKEIENSPASLEEKIESKSSVSKIRSILDKVKHPIKSFGKDVTNEIIVGYAAEEIVKLVFQLVSMVTLGVPIPPQILNLLKNIVKEFNK